jgi:serine/threonine protein kinase
MPLDKDRWQAVGPYLEQALGMDAGERLAWLQIFRASDPALAADLDELLREHAALLNEGFLEGESPINPPETTLSGQTVGAYTLESLIGQGGMGSIWLARRSDGRFEGHSAIKFLNAAIGGREGQERFHREGNVLARLTHPNIARMSDAGVSPLGQPYLVLEYIEGTQIDRYCAEHALDTEDRIRLFLDVLAAVAHAHANLIVHRDIKPSNVMVTKDGHVKLLDFGIAKLIEDDGDGATLLTREGGSALTPEYAAPEQVMGGPVTTATDVYSLGVLLYLLLSGCHPAGDALRSPAELMKAIVDTQPRRLSSVASRGLRGALKGDVETIVSKALKKDPHERYASVTAMGEDLRRYLAKQPISARADSLGYRTTKFVARHQRAVALATAALLIIVTLIGFYTIRLAAERDRARREAEKAIKVSELLTSLLTGADPFGDRQREPTVREVLDAGAVRAEKDLADQPEVQAEVLTVIGRTYYRLGLRDKARPLLERGLDLNRRTLGPEHVQIAESLTELGVVLRETADYKTAEKLLEEAVAMRRKLLGPDHKDLAVSLVELGRVYSSTGVAGRSELLFREALAIRRKVLGEEHRETAVSLSDLALELWGRGDVAGAEPLFRQSLAISRKTLGENHPNVAISISNLGLVLMDRQDYAGAESLFREALAIGHRTVGDKHSTVATQFNNLAAAVRLQGRYEEARQLAERAVEIAQATYGRENPRVAQFEVGLARTHLDRRDPASAEPLLRRALEIQRRAYTPGNWRIGMTCSLLGAALTELGRYGEAEPLLLEAGGMLKDVPGREGREAAATRTRLVALYEAWGKPEKAGPYRLASKEPGSGLRSQ